jgi:hypothetical protein
MPTSVRLDKETESLIALLARHRGKTKSEIIREALKKMAEQERDIARPATPYEAMAPSLGCAEGGPSDLSERTGQKFTQTLRTKKSA